MSSDLGDEAKEGRIGRIRGQAQAVTGLHEPEGAVLIDAESHLKPFRVQQV